MVVVCLLECYGGLVLGVLLQVLQHGGGEALRCSVSRHCLRWVQWSAVFCKTEHWNVRAVCRFAVTHFSERTEDVQSVTERLLSHRASSSTQCIPSQPLQTPPCGTHGGWESILSGDEGGVFFYSLCTQHLPVVMLSFKAPCALVRWSRVGGDERRPYCQAMGGRREVGGGDGALQKKRRWRLAKKVKREVPVPKYAADMYSWCWYLQTSLACWIHKFNICPSCHTR